MNIEPDNAIAISPPRIYPPGHPIAAKLREYYGVPVGGNRARQADAPNGKGGDIVSRLIHSYNKRNDRERVANRPAAIAAHADYVAGMTYRELQVKYHMTASTLRRHWRGEGLPYRGHGKAE